jgi:hypothetical protein
MSVEMKVVDTSGNSSVVLDSLVHWKNIYGVDKNFIPIDKNSAINLNQLKVRKSRLTANKIYSYSVRYRDHNLKWSGWSNPVSFNTSGIISAVNTFNDVSNEYVLNQNYPNPFRKNTMITYSIPEKSEVTIRIYDKSGRIVEEIREGVKPKGTYQIDFNPDNLSNDIYFYEMITNKFVSTRKMMKID